MEKEQERFVKGIWIPIGVWTDDSLSWNEKILLCEIDSYTSDTKDCCLSNEYIADLLGIGVNAANKLLLSLISKGFLIKTRSIFHQKYVKLKHPLIYINNINKNISTMYTTTENIHSNTCIIEEKEEDNNILSKKKKKFTKPTVEEVHDYVLEKGYHVDAETFFNFYESKGWMVGKSPMKNWRAAVATWEKGRKNSYAAPLPNGVVITESFAERNRKLENEKGW